MEKVNGKTNYQIAKELADLIDSQIIEILQQGKSFLVEAGAGSGKTYSLNKVIEWIQENKWNEYNRKMQKVVCITFTNAAVEVISSRISSNSFILPSTIHTFAWNAIKKYQTSLLNIIKNDEKLQPSEGDFYEVKEIRYTLGHRYQENGVHYLFHDDVIFLFATMLDNSKFRHIFSNEYPLILVDEYQDSLKPIIDRFINHFIAINKGPQFGFFGDAWQTIYQNNNACGLIEHENLEVIKKGSNFRSAPRIVEVLNLIRPDLPQQSAIDEFIGEIMVITNDDYNGPRRTDGQFKDDLPPTELKMRLDNITKYIKGKYLINEETLKILMITHKVLATQQGYERLLEILDDGLRDKQDIFLLFFMNIVEPIFEALETSNMNLLFETLGIKRYPIVKKSEKEKWKELRENLAECRAKKSIDVLKVIIKSQLIPVPPNIEGYLELYTTASDVNYSGVTIKEFLDINYSQFLAAISFLYPKTEYSTEHGVKGEEYDNVVFVIGKGWSNYQFEKYAPMIINGYPPEKETAFIRNRNLFYVCCSRPKKRLYFFITIKLDETFHRFLNHLVGEQNMITYSDFIKLQ